MIPTVLDCGFGQAAITLYGMLGGYEVYKVVFSAGIADGGAQPHYYIKLSGPVGATLTCQLLRLSNEQAALVQPLNQPAAA